VERGVRDVKTTDHSNKLALLTGIGLCALDKTLAIRRVISAILRPGRQSVVKKTI